MQRVLLISLIFATVIIFLRILVVLWFLITCGDQPASSLMLNDAPTCKHNNSSGICISKDLCLTNLTSVKLKPCNEADLSIVCCPFKGIAIPNNLSQADKNIISNHPKRAPGEKAKEMCRIYGKTTYKLVPTYSILGPKSVLELDCKLAKPVIKGGEDAQEKEFPHMVMIGNFEEKGLGQLNWLCSGSLVSPEFILSAAHCNVSEEYGYAMIGTTKIESSLEFLQNHVFPISRVIIHPDYNAANNDNDIALFKLSKEVDLSHRPICLDTGVSLFINMMVTATGFGVNKEQKAMDVLQKVNLNIVDHDLCASKYKEIPKPRDIPENSICAYSKGKDTCSIDSGGPIQIRNECMYTIVGITSFGDSCTRETDLPGVYTKVSSYIGWIEDIVWPA